MSGWYWLFEPGGSTWAFHGDDGMLYGSPGIRGKPSAGAEGFGYGDTLGYGWDIRKRIVFFTKNGVKLPEAFSPVKGRLFSYHWDEQPVTVTTNFGLDTIVEPLVW
jgi:hypothetical protein